MCVPLQCAHVDVLRYVVYCFFSDSGTCVYGKEYIYVQQFVDTSSSLQWVCISVVASVPAYKQNSGWSMHVRCCSSVRHLPVLNRTMMSNSRFVVDVVWKVFARPTEYAPRVQGSTVGSRRSRISIQNLCAPSVWLRGATYCRYANFSLLICVEQIESFACQRLSCCMQSDVCEGFSGLHTCVRYS